MRFDIPDSELRWRFGPSGGPGGQHANKSSTRAELSFEIETSRAFDEPMRERLVEKLGVEVRITEDGSRSQATNRKRAIRGSTHCLKTPLCPIHRTPSNKTIEISSPSSTR